ncbi:hypothetical protein BH11BAC1_BH11BAC1_15370 [soil metagenome]
MKNNHNPSAMHTNLTWLRRNQKEQAKNDFLFATVLACSLIGLIALSACN